ncbi:hypothetical protein [Rhodopseudomonas sp.]|uniref:hypothetical protein n=1 Tax=Rhodopseudomonas sp. TaxID=1078 RepID=UPI003B3ADFBF
MKHPHKGGSYRREPDGSLTRLAVELIKAADEFAIANTPERLQAADKQPADTKPARKAKTEK